MIFEVGKFYRHTTGHEVSIVGRLKTTMFGSTLIAETTDNLSFHAVGSTEAYAENYKEITKEEWMKSFSNDEIIENKDECEHSFTNNNVCLSCGEKALVIETRPCSDCRCFVARHNAWSDCSKHLTAITRDMRVTYNIKKGSCFEEKDEENDSNNK